MSEQPNEDSKKSSGYSDQGPVRGNNEDSFVADSELDLYAVADGVGGHAAGEVASKLAIDTVVAAVRRWRAEPGKIGLREAARLSVEAACEAVHQKATAEGGEKGMATTLSLVLVEGNMAAMAHVGDSRVYVVRAGKKPSQLSADHTMAAELARLGTIPPEQVEKHPYRHVLVRSLGSQPSVLVDSLEFEVHPGDQLLITSDGMNPLAEDPESFASFFAPGTTPDPKAMVEAAIEAGSADNVTVVVVCPDCTTRTETSSHVASLSQAEMFENLSAAGLLEVLRSGRVITAAAGETLVERGQEEDRLMTLLAGKLTMHLDEESRSVAPLESIGLSRVVAPGPSPCSVVADEDSTVFTISAPAWRRISSSRKNLGAALMRRIALMQAEILGSAPDPTTRLRGY